MDKASFFQGDHASYSSDHETMMLRSSFIRSCSWSVTYTFSPFCTLVKHMRAAESQEGTWVHQNSLEASCRVGRGGHFWGTDLKGSAVCPRPAF